MGRADGDAVAMWHSAPPWLLGLIPQPREIPRGQAEAVAEGDSSDSQQESDELWRARSCTE